MAVHIDLGPSEAVKAFVDNLTVSGVFQGDPPRLLIGNQTFEVGDVVNQDLGIVFTGLDPDRGVVLFKDSNGHKLEKKF